MTDDEALAILRDCHEWIDGGDDGKPDWSGGTVCLDGHFSVQELFAVLHFASVPQTAG